MATQQSTKEAQHFQEEFPKKQHMQETRNEIFLSVPLDVEDS